MAMWQAAVVSPCSTKRQNSREPQDALQVHAVQRHSQVGGTDLDAMSVAGRWEDEATLFEPLVIDDQTIAVPEEDLEPVAALVAEDEEMAAERISGQAVPDQHR